VRVRASELELELLPFFPRSRSHTHTFPELPRTSLALRMV